MSTRRDLLLGATCVAGAIAAVALEPRRYVSLMPRAGLTLITPAAFGAWTSRDVTDLVAPKIEGSLESRLYDQSMERIYTDAATGAEVMVLLAHGDTQSNELQLHRPEVCYPAFGFNITANWAMNVPLPGPTALPARALVARAPGRVENIVYWTRLGEYLPTSEPQQRLDRIRTTLHGVISDGLLARFSVVGEESRAAVDVIEGFVASLIAAVAPTYRAAFLGDALAAAVSRAG